MPQGRGHVRSWRYTFYVTPLARDHKGYVVIFLKKSPTPHEYLQRTSNMTDQQVWYGCTEEGGSLNLLGT